MSFLMRSIRQHPKTWFYSCWLLINLIQSAGTQLLDDEAYYWVYSRFPDWGYFDHPPMIAVLIKAGFAIFKNELGVRLFMAVMNAATLWLVQHMLLAKNDRLFYAIALSMGVLQIGGILAVPDIPLTFFTALFFFQYRRFLDKSDLGQSLLLGVVMALMLYSKYHGILIILLTLFSNPKLALRWQAWLAAMTGIILFAPHLWWQYTHDFPSVQYHLRERNAPAYRFSFTLEYILGQILLAGPLIGWMLLYAAGRFRTSDVFARALKYSMTGFYLFFLVSTLKGRVEANWTVPALVPLMILAHAWLSQSFTHARWVYRLMPPALIAVVLLRGYMITDIPQLTGRFKDEMHNNKVWAASIKKASGGLPVVFFNSYQRPSKYWFYTGDTSFALNTTTYRRSNYNFWPMESEMQGRRVFVVDDQMGNYSSSTLIETRKRPTYGKVFDNYRSYSGVQIKPNPDKLEIRQGRLAVFSADIHPAPFASHFGFNAAPENQTLEITLDIFKGKSLEKRIPVIATLSSGNSLVFSAKDTIQLPPGEYRAKLGISTSLPGIFSQNTAALPLQISK
ncbi:ArnT family glycosyltransferase [Flavihumibacter solisilvae]|uniref:Glycosyltransferase RgtA/B/C/D-like domain-containing protein n=1 Tax=Flavihumibacter solisilvae TaxID=1349421 RepID=A0A0C1LA68_9BACT|nr:glycosyltransferase family 39 protein [Flavihumibacter solisilvae]KIC96406.1 hypothetical protein OI18_01305 [Flavihumibacter solisilvae]